MGNGAGWSPSAGRAFHQPASSWASRPPAQTSPSKGLEESLRKSEERLLLAMSSANIGFWDWDVINGQITWSPELCEIFGVEAGTALTGLEESLRKSEERLLLAMSSANIGFWDWDVINGQITWSPELWPLIT